MSGNIDRVHSQTSPVFVPPTSSTGHYKVKTRGTLFWVDLPPNRADIERNGRLTFSSLFLPHHQLVIMKAESLVRRQIVNAETDH